MGSLEIHAFDSARLPGFVPFLLVDDFALEAGASSLSPRLPPEFEDRDAAWVGVANQVQFEADAVRFARLRTGGAFLEVGEREATLRFVELRAGGPDAGRLVGQLGDSILPRRLSLVGTVHEVDQRFLVPPDACAVVPVTPGGGGGGIAGGAWVTVVRPGSVTPVSPSPVELLGASGTGLQQRLAAPGVAAIGPAPTLVDLGITAPSGAEVTFDETGALIVASPGDLLVSGGAIDVPGLTSLTLETPGRIVVDGTLELPAGVALHLNAGSVAIGGVPGDPPEVVVLDPPPVFGNPLCDLLRPVFPAEERLVGSFSLVASAAEQVEIELLPAHAPGGTHRGRARAGASSSCGDRPARRGGMLSRVKTTRRSFVSYIDRTREYYAAQGYEKPYAWARHTDSPFSPLPKPLAECRTALVTTASPWRDPVVEEGVLRGGKQVYSQSAHPPPAKLFTDDLAWDKGSTHTDDVPSFLPLVQLEHFAREGRIGAAPVRFHGVPTDYSQRRTREEDAPELLARLREDAADVALLVPL